MASGCRRDPRAIHFPTPPSPTTHLFTRARSLFSVRSAVFPHFAPPVAFSPPAPPTCAAHVRAACRAPSRALPHRAFAPRARQLPHALLRDLPLCVHSAATLVSHRCTSPPRSSAARLVRLFGWRHSADTPTSHRSIPAALRDRIHSPRIVPLSSPALRDRSLRTRHRYPPFRCRSRPLTSRSVTDATVTRSPGAAPATGDRSLCPARCAVVPLCRPHTRSA